MSVLLDLLNGDVPRAMGWALIHLLWQGVLVASLVAVALRLMQRSSASARYVVAVGGLTLMLVLPVATGLFLYSSASPSGPTAWEPSGEVVAPLPARAGSPALVLQGAVAASVVERVRHTAELALPWMLAAWLLGVVLLSTRLAAGALGARRLCRQSSPAPSEWRQRFDALRRRMRIARPVRLLESAEIDVPMVVGWFRPIVLVPITALTGLSAQQLELILLHELAHIRRHDHLVNLLQTVAEIVVFYHPAAWWLSQQVRVERENCCDDLAVELCGSALPYARALLDLESLRVSYPRVVLAASGGLLHERILRLLHPERAYSERWISTAPLFGIVALLVVAAPLAVSAQLGTDSEVNDPLVEVVSPNVEEVLPDLMPPALSLPGPPSVPLHPPAPGPTSMPDPASMIDAGMGGEPAGGSPAASSDQRDSLNVEDLIAMQIHRVTPEFIREVEALGYRGLSPRQLVQMRIHGVTPEFVREMHAFGWGNLSHRDLVQLRIHRVTPEFIREMQAAGFGDLSWRELTEMRTHRVTLEFIREMEALGYIGLSHRQLVEMRIHQMTPEFVRELATLGYRNISAHQLVTMRIHRVTPEFIREVREAGFGDLTPDQLVRLRISGVDRELIESQRRAPTSGEQ